MATNPDQVASMAQEIKSVVKREGWHSDASVAPNMQKVLAKLTTLQVDVGLLKETNIGALVRKLTKHDDEIVRGYSTTLMKKWMEQVGVPANSSSKSKGDKSRSRSNSTPRAAAPEPPATPSKVADAQRLAQARKRLQDGYASEKAKKDSRTVQMLSRPLMKGKKGTTITTGPSRSSIAQHRFAQQRGTAVPQARGASAPPTSRPSSAPTNGIMSREEQHRLRQQKLRALREKNLRENGSLSDVQYKDPIRRPVFTSVRNERPQGAAPARIRSQTTTRPPAVAAAAPPPVNDRKAFLDKMFPRVCGVSGASANTVKAKKSPTAAATAGSNKKKSSAALNESQREVVSWLQRLEVDMSEYAPAFFANGFDSIKLLTTIEPSDLPGLIPKKGHHRLIQQALDDLVRQRRTAASSSSHARSGSNRDRDRPKRRHRNPYDDDDNDSDDSFVVSDGDEYTPGAIASMFRKNKHHNRKRSYSFDSMDSYNMEASFDEIQHEEERSTRYGEYEDLREDMRNKKQLKKKKK